MVRLRNVHAYTHHVKREGCLKARRKGWSIRFEPFPREETCGFAFGGRGVRYDEGFDDWEVFLIIIPNRKLVCLLVDCEAKYTVSPLVLWLRNGSSRSTYAVIYGTVVSFMLYIQWISALAVAEDEGTCAFAYIRMWGNSLRP